MRLTLSPRRSTRVLYAGLAVFATLTFFTARAVWEAWHERAGQARADAIFDLVEERTPLRPTDTPGATAWLQLELDRYGRRARGQVGSPFTAFATAGPAVPMELTGVLDALRTARAARINAPLTVVPRANTSSVARREQTLLSHAQHHFVVTRRRGATTTVADDPFVRAAVPILAAASVQVARSLDTSPLPAVPDRERPHPVRVYAISEDGALVSAPWPEEQASETRELALLSSRPLLPAFAPHDFFFRFPVDASPAAAWYSGFYLDLGGRGLVSTVMLPFAADGRDAVLALDIAFGVDWAAFARSVEAPVQSAAASLPAERASWPAFASALEATAPAALRAALDELARRDRDTGEPVSTPVRQGVAEDLGAVVAFQVADTTWLLMLFPQTAPAFPMVPLVLTAGLLALVLTGFEVNRRRADTERRNAERAFAEKQNLLDTMQVPLVVVDPNTDVIVSSNRSAETIGLEAGSRFADFVSPDPRARAHYQAMQVATPEPRRAYGVPVRVPRADGHTDVQHAVVRSVAVTAPIAALEADERHRLGIVFLLDRDTDLPVLEHDLASAAHRQERQRLAGLLSHGVDTLARVLEHQLTHAPETPAARAFTIWLSEYLERRLTVTGWLLDHWDAEPSGVAEVVIDASQARATIGRVVDVFELAARDRDMRARLHWSNGVLSSPVTTPVDVHVEWPDTVVISCPVRGGFGVFVGELLTNAIRHGLPGHPPRLDIVFDRVRRHLTFTITNDAAPDVAVPAIEAYGGLDIVRVMARLFGWPLSFHSRDGQFVVTWSAPASDRGVGGQPD